MTPTPYRFETQQLHAGQEQADPATGARAVPIYATSSYVFDSPEQAAARFALQESGNIYTRITNPTTDAFEKRMAALEGGAAALALASGSAAIDYALRNIAHAGDHIVADNRLYGGTYNLFAHTFKELGIEVSFVNGRKPEEFAEAIRPHTKALFTETLANPNCEVSDIAAIAQIAHANGLPLIVDNTLASPYLLRPIEHGADIVVHSATKFIGGHGTSIGGVVIDSGKFDWAQNDKFAPLTQACPHYHGLVLSEACGALAYIVRMRITLLRDQGACLSPFNSFLLLQGLETLSLRVERHVENALKVVEYLSAHPQVAKVNHPSLPTEGSHALYQQYFSKGAGSVFSFEIKGSKETASQFCKNLKLFSLLANVADAKSLVIHPASTTHSQLSPLELMAGGISEQTIRLSIGIEHIDDIIEALEAAFQTLL